MRVRVRVRVSALTQRSGGGDEQLAQPACRAWLARPHRVALREDVLHLTLTLTLTLTPTLTLTLTPTPTPTLTLTLTLALTLALALTLTCAKTWCSRHLNISYLVRARALGCG